MNFAQSPWGYSVKFRIFKIKKYFEPADRFVDREIEHSYIPLYDKIGDKSFLKFEVVLNGY